MNTVNSMTALRNMGSNLTDIATMTSAAEDFLMTAAPCTECGSGSSGESDFVFLNSTDVSRFVYDKAGAFVVTVIMPCILCLGCVSNVAFIIVFMRVRSMRTTTNIYLVNLSCADLAFLLSVISDKLVRYSVSPFSADYSVWGPNGCRIITAMIFLPHYVSELTITLFTFERYVAVCQPMKSVYFSSVKRTVAFIGATWLVATVFMAPCLYFIEGRYFNLSYTADVHSAATLPTRMLKCGIRPVTIGGIMTLQCYAIQAVPFFLTAVLMGVWNYRMIRTLNTPDNQFSYRDAHVLKATTERKEVIRMLLVTSIVFYVCLLPYFVDDVISTVVALTGLPAVRLPSLFLQFGRVFGFSNSAVNPLIYNAVSSKYRRAFRSVFCPCVTTCSFRRQQLVSSLSDADMRPCKNSVGDFVSKYTEDTHM